MGSWKEDVTMVHISQDQVEADLQCYICLDDLEAGEEVMKLRCSHHYHELCISPWLDKNNVCPTCRQKILSREDPDPEEYDFGFDSVFFTDIIRDISNIMNSLDADEEFLYSDSPNIVDEGDTMLLEERGSHSERNSTSPEVGDDNVDDEDLRPQESESEQQPPLSEASSGDEVMDYQNGGKCAKRRRSLAEAEDSSDEEETTYNDTVWLLQDVSRNQLETLSSHAQPMKEWIPYGVSRNNPLGSKKKLRKRQRRSPELDESQYNQDSSDEDFVIDNTYTTEVNNRNSEEEKQFDKEKENSEEPKRGRNNRSAEILHDDESDDGDLVFDMVEVESLVSKLLEIMNSDEGESNPNEFEETVQNCPEECSKRNVLSKENKGYVKNHKNTDSEMYSSEDSKFHLSIKDSALPKSVELITKDDFNSNVRSDRLRVVRNPNPCQRKGSKEKSVQKNYCSSDSENCEDTKEHPVKRKAMSSDSESINGDDCDDIGNIEDIISELWSIVGQDEEESGVDENGGSEKSSNVKTKQKRLQKKESPKRHKKNQP